MSIGRLVLSAAILCIVDSSNSYAGECKCIVNLPKWVSLEIYGGRGRYDVIGHLPDGHYVSTSRREEPGTQEGDGMFVYIENGVPRPGWASSRYLLNREYPGSCVQDVCLYGQRDDPGHPPIVGPERR